MRQLGSFPWSYLPKFPPGFELRPNHDVLPLSRNEVDTLDCNGFRWSAVAPG